MAIKRPFSQLKRTRSLVDEVANELARRISDGDFSPGDRLPTGAELTEAFGVSLAVVREAMSKLKHDGLIETQQGAGAFVTRPEDIKSFRLDRQGDDPEALRNIYELRLPFEGRAAALAAIRRTGEDIDALNACLERMADTRLEDDARIGADKAFHERIAYATHNTFYGDFFRFLSSHISASIGLARTNSTRFSGFSEQAHAEHVKIFAAVREGDPLAAENAAIDHVRFAGKRLGLKLD